MGSSWHLVRSGEGERETFPWGEIAWLANAALANSPDMTCGRVVIKAGERNPTHRHGNCWELLYLVSGRLRHHFGEESAEMVPGDLAVVAPGVSHWATTVSDDDAVMVVAYSTGTREMEAL